MELKGHSLIITPLDSHFSEMGRNVLTQHPLGVPAPPSALWTTLEDSRGLQQLSLPEPLAHSRHALCLKRKLAEVTGELSANQRKCLPNQVCDPGKFGPSQLQGLSYQHSINPGR